MSARLSEAYLKSEMCNLTEVVRTNQGFEISLPQAYATGNVVAVIVAESSDGFIVHDNSYASMILDRTGTKKATAMTKEVAESVRHYGCEMDGVRVSRKVETIDELALAAVLVGCASRLVADQALKVDRHPLYNRLGFKRDPSEQRTSYD